ncbi:MAG: PASTA domain-containing protein [Nitrospirota bacterium]
MQKKHKRGKPLGSIILRVLTLLSILLLIGVGGIVLNIFLPSSSQEKIVIVPDVTSKNLVGAVNILCKYKLRVKKEYAGHSLPKNCIISQFPLAGTKVKAGRRIELKVSSGKPVVRVPDLQNINIIEAKHKLDSLAKLQLGQLSYTYSGIEKDCIIAQSPLPKTKVAEDSKVNLLISQGNKPVSFYMPELVGMKLEEAINLTKKIGLKIIRIQEVALLAEVAPRAEQIDAKYEQGTIINHKPHQGYRVTVGDGVQLSINNY